MLVLGLGVQRVPDGRPDLPLRLLLVCKLITDIVIGSLGGFLAHAVQNSELLVVIALGGGLPS